MNKKKIKTNYFDQIFDTVISESLKANSKTEFLSDEKAVKLYQYILTGLLEIKWIKDAFIKEYIPRANQLYFQYQKEWKYSKYRNSILLDDNLLKETINETIRLGYIGLFHKYESFINGLVFETNEFFKDLWNSPLSLDQYIKKEFDINISNNWKLSKTLERINWICNSCKHYNGKPKKPIHPVYLLYNEDEKMVFSKKEFQNDCDAIEKYCEIILQFVNLLASYRLAIEENLDDEIFIEPTQKMIETKQNLNVQIKSYIEIIKQL